MYQRDSQNQEKSTFAGYMAMRPVSADCQL